MIEWLDEQQAASYSEPLSHRFGLAPDWLVGQRLLRFGSRRIYIAQQALELPPLTDGTSIEGFGISLLRIHNMAVPKPTFEGAGYLLGFASKNVLALTGVQAKIMRQGEAFSHPGTELTPGFILTHYDGVSFGCAHYRDGTVTSYFPKRYSHYHMVD